MQFNEEFKKLGTDCLTAFSDITKINLELPDSHTPKHAPRITTCTFVVKTTKPLDLSPSAFWEPVGFDEFFSLAKSKLSPHAVQLKVGSMPSVDVLVFPSGSIKAAGFKSHVELIFVLECLLCRLHQDCQFDAVQVVMINVAVTVPVCVVLQDFFAAVRQRGGYAEQPERPPSCTVKFNSTTAMVYSTGNVIVSASCFANVSIMYRFVMDALTSLHVNPQLKRMKQKAPGFRCTASDLMVLVPGSMHTHQPCDFLVDSCAYCMAFGNCFVTTACEK